MGIVALVAIAIMEEELQRQEAFRQLNLLKINLRDRSNPFMVSCDYFKRHYRLTQTAAISLINILWNKIEDRRSSAIPPHLQFLAALRFFAEGALQKGVARDFNHPMCQTTISKIITNVVNALISIENEYIKFPMTMEERQAVSHSFYPHNRIHNIIGLIDCFKVVMWRPSQNEETYYNYAVGSALNVQVISNANYIIQNVRCCSGSNTDQFIWRFSQIKDYLERLRNDQAVLQQEGRYYLLGDNGYTASPILLTPIVNAAAGSPEAMYTDDLTGTRSKIEQCFGILTNVYRCISRSRKLCYAPKKVAQIVHACAVLHNFRRLNGAHENDDIPHEIDLEEDDQLQIFDNNDYQNGLLERQIVINEYYL